MYSNNLLCITYFLLHTFLTFSTILLFYMLKISYINQLFSSFYHSKIMKNFLFFNLLSLGGLPPFLGFFPKMNCYSIIIFKYQLFMLVFMVLMTLITLYYYILLSYSAFMLNYYEINWFNNSMFKSMNMNLFMTFFFINTFGLFLFSSLYYLI